MCEIQIIETTSGKVLFSCENDMRQIRAWLRKHYTRFYCIVAIINGYRKQVSYHGKIID